MELNDLVVEVRDVNLRRQGQVEPEFLDVRLEPRYVAPGAWSVRLPDEHPLHPVLLAPGSGIIVTHTDPTIGVLLSGPSLAPTQAASKDDPQGTTVFTGTTDDVLLWRRAAYPTPSTADVTQQVSAYDVRTGNAESVMRDYVNANLGPGSPAARRVSALTLAANLNRGVTVTKSARFDVLGELLASIATVAGLGFRIVQVGAGLEFQVYDPTDKSGLIRLDLANGTLTSQSVERTAPSVTRAIVAGQGEGEYRKFVEVATSTTDESDYGMFGRIERFVDQRNTDDTLELTQAGLEVVLEGASAVAVKALPGDDQTMAYPLDWGLGDTLGLVVGEQTAKAQVTAVPILINAAVGVRVGASIGDVQGWDPQAGLRKVVVQQDERLSNLERNLEGGTSSTPLPGTDLNTLLGDGTWDIDSAALANTLANLPAPPLPAVPLNYTPNPKALPEGRVKALPNGPTWTVARHSGTVSPAGTTTWEQVHPASAPIATGIIASVYSVDGLGNTFPYARTVALTANYTGPAGQAAEWRVQSGLAGATAWAPLSAMQRLSWVVPANTYAVLEVRRAGGANVPATGLDNVRLTDVSASPGAGTMRAGIIGTLRVHNSGTRVLQTFDATLNVTGGTGVRIVQFTRAKGQAGWGPWEVDAGTHGANNYLEGYYLGQAVQGLQVAGQRRTVPFQWREMDMSNPGTFWTADGNTRRNEVAGNVPVDSLSWVTLTLASPWTNYSAVPPAGGYLNGQVLRTVEGIVFMRGLVAGGTVGSVICTLPFGYRPAYERMFNVCCAAGGLPEGSARVQVNPDGTVRLVSYTGSATAHTVAFMDLNDIMFPCVDAAPAGAWTPLTLANGFADYGLTGDYTWGPASYWQDGCGRVWLNGLVYRPAGAPGTQTAYATLPAALAVESKDIMGGVSNGAGGFVNQEVGGNSLSWRAGGVAFMSLPQYPLIPATVASGAAWAPTGFQGGWSNYGAGYSPSTVWRAPDGIAHLRGLLAGPGGASAITPTFSAGFRPTIQGQMLWASLASDAFGRNDTLADGMIWSRTGASGWRSIYGMTYILEG